MARDGHADSTYTQRGRERVTMRCHSVGGGMIRRDDEDESQSPNRLTEVEPAASTRL